MAAPQTFSIAAIPGDGVGKEVVAAGRQVLDALADRSGGRFAFAWTDFPWGSDFFAETGRMMDEDGLAQLAGFDALYFGAVGWPTVPDHVSLWGLRLAICQGFDQWANVRPVTFLPGIESPLRKAAETDLDWVVVRENSEGEYGGFGGRNFAGRGPGGEVAVQSAVFTEVGCERIMRFAFDLARTRPRRRRAHDGFGEPPRSLTLQVAVNSVRDRTPSFAYARERWCSIVFSLRKSAAAACLLERP